jgi:nitroreductase
MTLKEIIESRRSIRQYRPEKIERSLLEELIEMAICAPSASNAQGWRFFIVDESTLIQKMALLVQEHVDQIASRISAPFLPAFQNYGNYFVRFAEAPAVIIPVYRSLTLLSQMLTETLPENLQKNIQDMEENSGIVSVSLAIQNLMLYAHHLGLGSSCMTGPLVASQELLDFLKIPKLWKISALIPLGYPAETPTLTSRKSVKSVIRWVSP